MFKPLPQGTIGYVTQAASRIATTLAVDTRLHDILSDLLAGGHHTYIHVVSVSKVEVIKVVEVLGGNAISVRRGLDGTDREAILESARVFAALNLSAIYDQVRGPVTPITLTATGDATANPIHSPVVQIKSDGRVEVISQWNIVDGNVDPCEPYVCPGYVIGPYYLTSHPYPHEETEAAKVFGIQIAGRIYLGYLESLEAVIMSAEQVAGTIRTLLRTYTHAQDATDHVAVVAEQLEGTIRTLLKTYNHGQDNTDNVEVFSEQLAGTIVTLLITYNHAPDNLDFVRVSGEQLAGTIT